MVNRIQEIIKRFGLTPARFADELEVPRSTISHLLSGRNNPSLEFVQKILNRYPEIDVEWLIRGKGSIAGKSKDLFSELDAPQTSVGSTAKTTKNSVGESQSDLHPPENEKLPPTDQFFGDGLILSDEKSIAEPQKPIENEMNRPVKKESNNRPKIVRIITFYENYTFDEFFPAD